MDAVLNLLKAAEDSDAAPGAQAPSGQLQPSRARPTHLSAEDLLRGDAASGDGDQAPWSRVVKWVQEGLEHRVAVVVAAAPAQAEDCVWVLWQHALHSVPMRQLFPYPVGATTSALEWLANAALPTASVHLPPSAAAPEPASTLASHLQPGLHHQTVSIHANKSLWVTADVHHTVQQFFEACNWLSKRALHVYGVFCRLLTTTIGSGPAGIPKGVCARLRAWFRRCYQATSPSSHLFTATLEQQRAREAARAARGPGVPAEPEEWEEEEGEEEDEAEEGKEGKGTRVQLPVADAVRLDYDIWPLLLLARDTVHRESPCESATLDWARYHLHGMSHELDALACRAWEAVIGEGMCRWMLS